MTPEEKKSGRTEGERQRDKAFTLLEVHREHLQHEARRAAMRIAIENGRVTPDDIRELVEVPPGINPVALGPVCRYFATKGILQNAGFEKSCRPIANSRPVTVWGLADRSKAESWLAANPPRPPIHEGGGDNA